MPSPLFLSLCTTSCCCSLGIRNSQKLLLTDQFLLLRILQFSYVKHQLATQIGSQICNQCGIDFMYFITLQLLHMSVSAYTSSSIIQNPCISYFWNYCNALHGIVDGGVGRHQCLISRTIVTSNARSKCALNYRI